MLNVGKEVLPVLLLPRIFLQPSVILRLHPVWELRFNSMAQHLYCLLLPLLIQALSPGNGTSAILIPGSTILQHFKTRHTIFVGPDTSFNVQLIVQGQCGPDTVTRIINLLPEPVLHPTADQVICQGTTATIEVTVDNGTGTIVYSWSGNPTPTCPGCASTTVTGLAVGGPYTYTINIIDGNGCVADSLTHITVNPTPIVNAGNDTTVCRNTSLVLNANVTTGTGPFTYLWSPPTGLNDPTLKNPTATITGSITYSVVATICWLRLFA